MKTQGPLTLDYRTVASVLALVGTMPANAQTTDTWILGSSGLWNVAANWSADVVPDNGSPPGSAYNVNIADGISTVTVNVSPIINSLTIGSNNTLVISGGQTLTIDGPTIANRGAIQLAAGSGGNATLAIGGNVTLSGPGALTLQALSGGGNAFIEEAAGGLTLTNQSTIQGTGIIGETEIALVNSGTIDANSTAGIGGIQLYCQGGVTNTGTLEATGGSTLRIATSVANSGSGATITASGTGSVVDLVDAKITGGTLTANSGGALETQGTVLLSGVTIAAGTVYQVSPGSQTLLSGSIPTFTNNGTVAITGSAGSNAYFGLKHSLILGGVVTLTSTVNDGEAYMQQNSSGVTLTATGTVQGSGVIGNGLTLINSGTLDANASGSGQSTELLLNGSGTFTNNGILQVASGDLLVVDTSSFSNFSGTSLKGGTYNITGTLQIDNLGTTGGEIKTNNATIILNGSTPLIEDASGKNALAKLALNDPKGDFTLEGEANFTTAGNFNNEGTLSLGAGSTFTVGMTFKNFAGTTLTGGTYDLSGNLEFKGANIVTNAANILLEESTGEIIDSLHGTNALANYAINSAGGSFSLANATNFTTSGNFSNAGMLNVGSGSTFAVGGPGIFSQTAGTTVVGGVLIASGGATLSGGALYGTGTMSGNLTSSGIVNPGAAATKTGIFTDSGIYTQNSGGSLDIGIGSKLAGSGYGVLDSTTAVLGGTLNLTQLKTYVPPVGTTFRILNFNSETGTFATVNGLSINSSESYTILYQPTDVLLTVISSGSTAGPSAALPSAETGRVKIGGEREWMHGVGAEDHAARLTAVLNEANSFYAEGGKQARAIAKEAALSKQLLRAKLDVHTLIKTVRR